MPKSKSFRNLSSKNGKLEIDENNANRLDLKIHHDFHLTGKQKGVMKLAHDEKTKLLMLNGLPGTGKTTLAMLIALEKYQRGEIDEIAIIRSTIVSKDSEVGFLSGDLGEKTYFLSDPFWSKVKMLVGEEMCQEIMKKDIIKFYPSGFLRSYSFDRTCIIASEVQNLFFESIFTISCRAEDGAFVILEGDSIMQNDLGRHSGFEKFIKMFSDYESKENGIEYYQFDEKDIVRSGLVQYLVTKRLKYEKMAMNVPANYSFS